MKKKTLQAKNVGIPLFPLKKSKKSKRTERQITLFDLSSHARANEAMAFGLKMRSKGFHVFVVGEDRSGRMTATLSYLKQYIQALPAPQDWVYLNNFSSPHRPQPYNLPAGKGCLLKRTMTDLVAGMHSVLLKTFSHPHYTSQIDAMTTALEAQVQEELQSVQEFAKTKGLSIEETSEGFSIQYIEPPEEGEHPYATKDVQEIKDRLNRITSSAHLASRQLNVQIQQAKKKIAEQVIEPLFQHLRHDFDKFLKDWIDELLQDILEHVDDLLLEDLQTPTKLPTHVEERYSVNVFVDNKGLSFPEVVLEPSPTYENLFGSIKYRALAGGGMETNFTMIRPGALHRANGGILVLRVEALAQAPEVWESLKAALRDQRIRIEERHREASLPLLDAPGPVSIPLDVQVFLIGAPNWFYSVFFHDSDFRTYFKIKAEIDPDLPVDAHNLKIYQKLIEQASILHTGQEIELEATQYLMGYSARWVGHRNKLNSKFELIADVLSEASTIASTAPKRKSDSIRIDDIRTAIRERRKRTSRHEDRSHEDIITGQILLDTTGSVVGQVNGLSVITTGDHQYGLPNRISARTYAGEFGVINIERLTEMSGPIQQKGVLILDGYLNGKFAQKYPLSCGCSITFEQNYGGVEGDSASLAELVAILSSLSGIPIRQDIAMTGSINQFGEVQPVGGVIYKIEGFYRTCADKGLSGTQGVIIPHSNMENVILREEIVEAVERGDFTIYTVKKVEEALAILTDQPAKTIFSAVAKKLALYHESLEKLK